MIFKKLARCKKDIKLEQLPVLFEIIESKSIQMLWENPACFRLVSVFLLAFLDQ